MQRQTNLIYKVSFRSFRATQRNLVLKGKKKGRKERKTKDTDYWHKQNVIFSTHLFGIFTEYLDCSSSCSGQHTGLLVRWHSLFSGDCEPQCMSPQRSESKICEHNRFCMESFRYKIMRTQSCCHPHECWSLYLISSVHTLLICRQTLAIAEEHLSVLDYVVLNISVLG